MQNPKVSICVPTYNGKAFLREALDSILLQTYDNLEVIVSDDASEDSTLDIVEDFKKHSAFPVFIHHHIPSGIGANWNNCLRHANGAYIKFLFQDDVLKPTCIEKMVAEMEKNSAIGLVYSKRDFLFDKDNEGHLSWINTYKNLHASWKDIKIESGKICKGTDLLKDDNLLKAPKNKIGEPTAVLLKREVIEKVGDFSTKLKQELDMEYWYRMLKYCSVVYIDEPLVLFRLHGNQATEVNVQDQLDESYLLEKSLYSQIFWQLSWENKRRMFFNFSFFGRVYRKLKKKVFNS